MQHTPHSTPSRSSAALAPNASWEWTTTGTDEVSYLCVIHPMMKGTLVVR